MYLELMGTMRNYEINERNYRNYTRNSILDQKAISRLPPNIHIFWYMLRVSGVA